MIKILTSRYSYELSLLLQDHLDAGYNLMGAPSCSGNSYLATVNSSRDLEDDLPSMSNEGYFSPDYAKIHKFFCDHCRTPYYFQRSQCRQCGSPEILVNPKWKPVFNMTCTGS